MVFDGNGPFILPSSSAPYLPVRVNVKLRDMNVTVPAHDEREVEVLASGLPLHHGAQLVVDVTLRSAVTTSSSSATQTSALDVPTQEPVVNKQWIIQNSVVLAWKQSCRRPLMGSCDQSEPRSVLLNSPRNWA